MDGARFVLLWGDGCEAFTDERNRSERARELHLAGQVTAAWTERTLDVVVRLRDCEEFAYFEWGASSDPRDIRAAYPDAVAYAFPDSDDSDSYTGPWLTVGLR